MNGTVREARTKGKGGRMPSLGALLWTIAWCAVLCVMAAPAAAAATSALEAEIVTSEDTSAFAEDGGDPEGDMPSADGEETAWETDDSATSAVEAAEDAAPRYPRLFYAVADLEEQKRALREERADVLPLGWASSPAVRDAAAALTEEDGIEVAAAPGFRLLHLGLNTRDWPLSERSFRQGIAHAVHRDELAKAVLGPFGEGARGFVPTASPFFHDEASLPAFDAARAAELLEELDFTLDDDGMRQDPRTEEPLTPLVLLVPLPEEGPVAYEAGRLIADALEQVGIPVELEPLPFAQLQQRIFRFDFDMYVLTWALPRHPAYLYSLFHSSQDVGGGLNTAGIRRFELDRALGRLRRANDLDEALRAARRAQTVLAQELPVLPLLDVPLLTAVRQSLFNDLGDGDSLPRYWSAADGYRWAVDAAEASSLGLDSADGDDGALRWILPTDPGPLNPWSAASGAAWTILEHVYEPLWAVTPETGEPAPRLAETWTVQPLHDEEGEETTRITFRLREGVRWHDGTPVTAEDVAFTFQQALEGRMARAEGALNDLQRVETDGERDVSLFFEGRSYWHFYGTDIPIVPRHLWQDVTELASVDGADAAHPEVSGLTRLVGTGPFVFVGKTEDGAYRLVPYEDYTAPGPFVPWDDVPGEAPIPGDDVVPGDDPPRGFEDGGDDNGNEGRDEEVDVLDEEDGVHGGHDDEQQNGPRSGGADADAEDAGQPEPRSGVWES